MRRRIASAFFTVSRPRTRVWPSVRSSSVISTWIVVVLPAPLGPRKPKTSPRPTVNETPCTARVPSGYTFVRSWTSITFSLTGHLPDGEGADTTLRDSPPYDSCRPAREITCEWREESTFPTAYQPNRGVARLGRCL